MPVAGSTSGEQSDEAIEVAAQQGFPAREPHFVDPEVAEDVDQAGDLLEVQDLLAGQPDVLFFRHAVLATQVAPVGDRDPEIPERPPVEVAEGRHQAAPAGAASPARARSHSRTRLAFHTRTWKWSQGIRSSTARARVV